MSFKDWHRKRLEQAGGLEKGQPQIRLPNLPGLEREKGTKTLSTPAQWRTVEHQRGPEEGIPQSSYGDAAGWYDRKLDTSFVNGNIDPKRHDAIAQHEQMHQLFENVARNYGKKFRYGLVNHILSHGDMQANTVIRSFLEQAGYDMKHPSTNEEVLNYYHSYMTDPVNRERIRSTAKSNWVRNAIDTKIKQSWRRMIRAAANVSHRDMTRIQTAQHPAWVNPYQHEPEMNKSEFYKAYDDKDWNRLTAAHSPAAIEDIDHTFHTLNGNMPKGLKNMLSSTAIEPHDDRTGSGGIAPKIVTSISAYEDKNDPASLTPQGKVMVKPYHKAIEPDMASCQKLPITGWATMATKALFNAGKIGHMAEDVTAAEHKGIPITIHTFADESMKDVARMQADPSYGDFAAYEANHLHLQQIAAMDFLANNLDRHTFNLMYEHGSTYHPNLLAIDHERNFQYQDPIASHRGGKSRDEVQGEVPSDYEHGAVRKILRNMKASGIEHSDKLADKDYTEFHNWWREHGGNIRKEMENQLAAIKDQRVREHIRKNFNTRADIIDKWAADGGAHEHMSLFDPEFSDTAEIHAIKPKYGEKVEDIVSKLPANDRYLGAKMLADLAQANPDKSDMLNEALDRQIQTMNPEELGSFFANYHNHPTLGVLPLVHEFIKKNPRRGEYVQSMIDKLRSIDQTGTRLFPFLAHLADANAFEGPTAKIAPSSEGQSVA